MKKGYILSVCLVVLMVFATQVFAEYDKDMVVKAMKSNGAAMGALQKAAKDGDFFTAAEKLMEIAKNMKSLEKMTPTKGSKEDWDKNHGALIKAAFKGIGACGDEDAEALNKYIGEIGALIKEGHGMFR
jgi:hypothetical protein